MAIDRFLIAERTLDAALQFTDLGAAPGSAVRVALSGEEITLLAAYGYTDLSVNGLSPHASGVYVDTSSLDIVLTLPGAGSVLEVRFRNAVSELYQAQVVDIVRVPNAS